MDGKLLRKTTTKGTTTAIVEDAEFADDQGVVTQSFEDLNTTLSGLDSCFREGGLTMSYKKTESMHCIGNPDTATDDKKCVVDGHEIKRVDVFRYLGSFLSSNGEIDLEIRTRLSKASYVVSKLRRSVWLQKNLTIETKLGIYRATVLSILLYACEAWCTKKRHIEKLESFHTRNLRSMLGIMYSDRVPNHIVRQRALMPETILVLIQRERLRWLGHVERMDDNRLPKQVLHAQLAEGSRPFSRPKKRWVDCVREDLRCFDIPEQKWASLCQDRVRWRSLLHKGKEAAIAKATAHEISIAQKRSDKRDQKRVPNISVPADLNGCFHCTVMDCSRKFTTKIGLGLHLKSHKHQPAAVDLQCSFCGKQCKNASGLTRHLKTHSSSVAVALSSSPTSAPASSPSLSTAASNAAASHRPYPG